MIHDITIDDALFMAFKEYEDPQAEHIIWALREIADRLNVVAKVKLWRPVRARVEHDCVRDCLIEPRDVYFKSPAGSFILGESKFCAGCFAMIYWFREADRLPPVRYDQWDADTKQPILVGSANPLAADFFKRSHGF
ncbi:MAG: hypothetical protein GY938_25695 [Ketobacter sp.]|nr:hypothetical protein [Ketobacter sp.]